MAVLGALAVAAAAMAAALLAIHFRRAPEPFPPPGTQRMAARLQEILERERALAFEESDDSRANPWRGNRPELIPRYRREIASAGLLGRQIDLRLRLARELLWCGQTEEALQEIEDLQAIALGYRDRIGPQIFEELMADVRELASIGFLRLGEQENCVSGHNRDSCLFPIQGGGVHRIQRGSRDAIGVLAESLRANPQDLSSRWLLNLAYMTVGEYPGGVPAEWLIPESVFASEHDPGRFPDVAPELGVDAFGLAGGSIVEDFDGDGDLDIMASGWSLSDQLRYFRNDGGGTFTDRTEAAGLIGEVGGLNITHADFNNDGFPDVFICRGGWLGDRGSHPGSLLRNSGDGTFEDITEEAGLLSFHPGQVAAWGDFDGDGWVDLFLGREDDPKGSHPSQLFRNNGDGTFSDRAPAMGIDRLGFVKGAAWGDFDNDGLQDLYVSCMEAANILLRNAGKAPAPAGWSFVDVTEKAGVGEPLFSFPVWFWDYDNDGWLDLFAGGFNNASAGDVAALYLGLPQKGATPRLYRNNGDGTFTDATREGKLDRVLLAMGANFGDIDNDGFPDAYIGTGAPNLRTLMPNRMFRNSGGKFFQDVTTSGGFGHLQKGHGIAFGDLDNDGDQDIYAVMGGWYSGDGFHNVLFENPGNGNRWITLRLEGTRSNRAGIGARIRVRVSGGGGPREIHALAGTGGSFGGSSLQQEIGLGRAAAIDSIEIVWPVPGSRQTLLESPLDRVIRVREGDPGFTVIDARPFRFSRNGAAMDKGRSSH